MAIAPSKLGRLVAQEWHSAENLVLALRDRRLVRSSVSDEELKAVLARVREEHDTLPPGQREFNSPNERVRVFLHPYLTWKGKRWAVPLNSLEPWWKIWD